MSKTITAGPNRQISLTFSLKLASGQLIDKIEQPATFTWGDESLLPAFQKALMGTKAGDKRSVFVQAKDGFGDISDDNIQYFKPEVLAEMQIEPELGMVISFNDDHRTNMGDEDVSGVVKALDDEWVTIDFNHPLAGQDLMIEYEIHDIKMTPMELGIPITDTTLDDEAEG